MHAKEKAERETKEAGLEALRILREQAPPEFFNQNGSRGPILVNGIQHSTQGPFMDLWCVVTVVNPTQAPMKIVPRRLILAGEECPVQRCFFRVLSNPRAQFEQISLRGNDKEDYELHFFFPDDRYPEPPARDGEFWLWSSNRAEDFSIKVRCP